jgi:ketosteroid isomerase-like protein
MTGDDSLRAANLEAATRALAAISRLDVPAVLAETHPDLVFELPYEKMPALDRDRFAEMLAGITASFSRFTMELVEVLPGLDPNSAVLRYQGDCLSEDGTVAYRNSYIAIMDFTDGRISRWREYANPVLTRKMNESLRAVRTGP